MMNKGVRLFLVSVLSLSIAGVMAVNTSVLHASEETETAYSLDVENADETTGDVMQTIEVVSTPSSIESPEAADPAEELPVQDTDVAEAPAEELPAQEADVAEAPAEELPAQEADVAEAPAEELPAQDTDVAEAPAEELPAQEADPTEGTPEETAAGKAIEEEAENVVNSAEQPAEVPGEEHHTYTVNSFFVNCSEGPLRIGSTVCWVCEIEGLTGTETVTYQWQCSADNAGWVDIGGANDSTYYYTVTEENASYYWRVIADIQ